MKVLFLGDSITDTGRNTNSGSTISIGQGYAMLIDGRLSVKYPGEFIFENFGISGNRVVDIYARIKADCWNRNPDVLSLLIGVNDVWHEVGSQNGVDAKRFENVYRMLVCDTFERFPNMKFIAMEPFVLRAAATDAAWDIFASETALRGAVVKKIAEENGLIFLPLQKMFDDACKIRPADYWLADGVHPTPAGHQLIADAWIDAFEKNVINK